MKAKDNLFLVIGESKEACYEICSFLLCCPRENQVDLHKGKTLDCSSLKESFKEKNAERISNRNFFTNEE